MPTKRQVFDLLTRAELTELVERHDITPADRRANSGLAAALDVEL